LGRAEIRRRVIPWLERLGIAQLADRRTRTLSGGELQRTSLARALALEPELLLLDEPFSSLDPFTRESLLIDLRDILLQTGVTSVFVTHDRHEAFMLGTRVGVLREGRLLQLGSGVEVFTQPADEKVADIVGADNRIRAMVESCITGAARLRFEGGAVDVRGEFRPGAAVLLCLRPEDIHLSSGKNTVCGSGNNHLAVRVVKVIPSTPQPRLILESAAGTLTVLTPRSTFAALDIHEGDLLSASFDLAAVHVIIAE
jgi:tungstate transport system ATP-binding protein